MRKKLYTFEEHLREQLKDPEFRKYYEAYDLPMRIAMEIALVREKQGLTQAELAKKMGVSQQMVAHIENLDETMPTVRTLEKVAHALGKQLHISFR